MDLSGLRTLRTLTAPPPAGIYARDVVPMATYLGWDAVSAGLLKDVRSRGTLYAAAARRVATEDTDATERGTAVHMAILEPHDFERCYAALPIDVDLRTNSGKEAKAKIVRQGRRPIKASAWEACVRLRDRAWEHPVLRSLLEACEPETTAVWDTGVGGWRGKARADVLCRDARMILDLKTTRDGGARAFASSAAAFGYHLSAPWYMDGFTEAGCPIDYWTLAALECDEDVGHYDVRLYTIEARVVSMARLWMQSALSEWAAATRDGGTVLSSHPETFLPLQLPTWAME